MGVGVVVFSMDYDRLDATREFHNNFFATNRIEGINKESWVESGFAIFFNGCL